VPGLCVGKPTASRSRKLIEEKQDLVAVEQIHTRSRADAVREAPRFAESQRSPAVVAGKMLGQACQSSVDTHLRYIHKRRAEDRRS
jgi:hypothetical protein